MSAWNTPIKTATKPGKRALRPGGKSNRAAIPRWHSDSGGWFYIKANSDRRWFTDKTDRCNANPAKAGVMQPVTSEFKASTIAARMPFSEFPKECWVTFTVEIDWTQYGGQAETVVRPGRLDVWMAYSGLTRHIVDNEQILIGRNDEDGYYFKFGIYRVGDSTEPVSYNLAGYAQRQH